jgi:serine/threonine-protein kinase RsbT
VSVTRTRITTESDLSVAVLEARRIALEIGFSAVIAAKIATAVSELTRNVLKYAERGVVDFRPLSDERGVGLEVVVTDQGPGIEDVDVALQDHFSSSGTLGLGLPGVRRLMDEFELASTPGEGTRVTIRKRLS